MRVSLGRWEVYRHAAVLFWHAVLSMSEQMYQRRITTTPFPFKTLWRLPCAAARHPVLGAHAPYSFTSLFPSSILFRLQGISNLCHRWLGIGSSTSQRRPPVRFEDQAWFGILSKAFRAQCCGTATRTVEISSSSPRPVHWLSSPRPLPGSLPMSLLHYHIPSTGQSRASYFLGFSCFPPLGSGSLGFKGSACDKRISKTRTRRDSGGCVIKVVREDQVVLCWRSLG